MAALTISRGNRQAPRSVMGIGRSEQNQPSCSIPMLNIGG